MSAREDFLALSAALLELPRDAPDYADAAATLEEIGRGLSPRWIAEAGEQDVARFDVVLAFDNSLAHMLTNEDLEAALASDRKSVV